MMLHVDGESIRKLLDFKLGIRLSEEAFRLHSSNQVEQPLRTVLRGSGNELMGVMPAYIKSGPYQGFGLKSVVVRLGAEIRGPSHMGSVLIYDEAGASPVVAVDAGAITEIRTAAASAYATSLLAAPNASRLAILGTGLQARSHLLAMQAVRPIKQLSVWGRTEAARQEFAIWSKRYCDFPISTHATVAEAVHDSDIICATTAARSPILNRTDLPAHCHVNAIGSSALGFQELHEDMYEHSALFTDCNRSVLASSECVIKAVQKGLLTAQDVGTEIGTVHANRALIDERGVSIFKSVGLAVQDLVFSREAIRRWLSTCR
ncbi:MULTISPECIES: ornithine cyclodeaminase family protein [unclassified Brenneria]|uniref:ornithine cyclodeaminase family protein n=1 Tax=unclassified Brenneria TaxID=2634434 RepID=UPI0018F0D98E|nr:ornithine cyclodeaminase family protein [Brenneria sp. L3-3C-1]MBJ7223538.1 ornithine cyclodeaminase family protein [Brenneria sp. L3-3C-1]MEE3644779.1 ornithine cyclodeaminase family protein [Brenneria sp. L3_3C_1]